MSTPFILQPQVKQFKTGNFSLSFAIDFSTALAQRINWPNTNTGLEGVFTTITPRSVAGAANMPAVRSFSFSMIFGETTNDNAGQLIINVDNGQQVYVIAAPTSTSNGGTNLASQGVVTGCIPILSTDSSVITFSKFNDGNNTPHGLLYGNLNTFDVATFLLSGNGSVSVP